MLQGVVCDDVVFFLFMGEVMTSAKCGMLLWLSFSLGGRSLSQKCYCQGNRDLFRFVKRRGEYNTPYNPPTTITFQMCIRVIKSMAAFMI